MSPAVTTLPQLIANVEALTARVTTLEKQLAALTDRFAPIETQLASTTGQVEANIVHLTDMQTRYDGVVDEMGAIAAELQQAVSELSETDEVSGWKQWKEQQRAAGKDPVRSAG